jgi:hypothetical protein
MLEREEQAALAREQTEQALASGMLPEPALQAGAIASGFRGGGGGGRYTGFTIVVGK